MTFLSRRTVRFLLLASGYICFLSIGAGIFSVIEGPIERNEIQKLTTLLDDFLTKNPCVDGEDLKDLVAEVAQANNRGVSPSRNNSGKSNWSFGQSFFFAGTVITTIGYGRTTPLSVTGKFVCIIFATIGIPLTLVLLSAVVERLLKPTTVLLQWLTFQLGHLFQPFNIRILHLLILILLFVTVFLMAPAGIFTMIEAEWNFLDSIYYCFISLTTIGLGDYIPGEDPNQREREFYKIATTVYLLVGLTFMMLALAVFYDIPQLNFSSLFKTQEDIDNEKAHLARAESTANYGIDMKAQVEGNSKSNYFDNSPRRSASQ